MTTTTTAKNFHRFADQSRILNTCSCFHTHRYLDTYEEYAEIWINRVLNEILRAMYKICLSLKSGPVTREQKIVLGYP